MKAINIGPIRQMLEVSISPADLSKVIDAIMIRYATLNLKEAIENGTPIDTAEHIHYLHEIREVLKEVSDNQFPTNKPK